jgi:hypothetical protein
MMSQLQEARIPVHIAASNLADLFQKRSVLLQVPACVARSVASAPGREWM